MMLTTAPLIETIARAAHEMNRYYCNFLGDHSQPSWENAPEWQKDSARAGVLGILEGTITTPRQSHESWMRQKTQDGWVYGDVKDPDAKTHPCMVDYDLLPEEQKAKDAIFHAVVRGMAAIGGVS